MKKFGLIILAVITLLSLGACGGGQKSIDYSAFSQKFVDTLFSGKFDEAKASVGPTYSDDLSEDIDNFANVLYSKYQFQEWSISSTRGWGPANVEVDKRVEVTFQYADKGKDNWAIGQLYVRIKNNGTTWEIADLQLLIPTN